MKQVEGEEMGRSDPQRDQCRGRGGWLESLGRNPTVRWETWPPAGVK